MRVSVADSHDYTLNLSQIQRRNRSNLWWFQTYFRVSWEFPGGLVVRTWRFHCPGRRTKVPQAACKQTQNPCHWASRVPPPGLTENCLCLHFDSANATHGEGSGTLLPGKSHGWRSLVGCSPWGCEESDITDRLHFHFSLSCIGEGNGNTLQYSCLENPRDGGAWWAAVYRVTQSWTWLKWLSINSSSIDQYNKNDIKKEDKLARSSRYVSNQCLTRAM